MALQHPLQDLLQVTPPHIDAFHTIIATVRLLDGSYLDDCHVLSTQNGILYAIIREKWCWTSFGYISIAYCGLSDDNGYLTQVHPLRQVYLKFYRKDKMTQSMVESVKHNLVVRQHVGWHPSLVRHWESMEDEEYLVEVNEY
jgi:hypothetical protein